MKTKIVIVDDYPIFREGLKSLLEKDETFIVVGEATNSTELFNLLKQVTPHVIVMDLMLPNEIVISISKTLSQKYPDIPFIIITFNLVEFTLLECVINGASGIVWKDNSVDDLIKAIRTVAAGERYFEIPESMLVQQILQQTRYLDVPYLTEKDISDREADVLRLIADGYSFKQIADQLNISPRTVETHKANILTKLGLHSVADLVKYAIKHQLISLK